MNVVTAPHRGNHTLFLSGPPGAGKTTLAVERLRHLLVEGVPAEQILILVPQRTLATPYYRAIHDAATPAGTVVDVATVGGLARRTIELFWPLVAEPAGLHPEQQPRFLTLETTHYYMDRLAGPFLEAGAFEGITISRPRMVSQIIDNLNKAAAVGFAVTDIAARLSRAWSGDSARLKVYEQVQALAVAFRSACLENNLLDWSLQIELFWHHLLPLPQLRRYLLSGYRHLIVDNVEEDIPASHDLLRVWLPLAESALVVYDTGGGYRVFLGADPDSALSLAAVCREHVVLDGSHVAPPEVLALADSLVAPFADPRDRTPAAPREGVNPRQAMAYNVERFHPEMLDWVADEISRLVQQEGYDPGQIAVLSPFLSDALRFSLTERLSRYGIAVRTHRPSRELREAPAARALLTLTRLAHPAWRRPPPAVDVAHALGMAIADLDPVRARLLADIVYRVDDGQPVLLPFHQIVPGMQERISYLLGARYDELRQWMDEYRAGGGLDGERDDKALDHFFSRLFGEVLSQPGFGFHRNLDAGAVTAELIESVRKFRRAVPGAANSETGHHEGGATWLALEYVDMVERGVVAAQYLESWQIRPENAVLLVPAYTFLVMNHPVDVQFWLNAGDASWFQRIYQPLTHPYVLRRDWEEGEVWTDEDEVEVQHESITRMVRGLAHRTRRRIYLAFSELDERGYEQQGPLRASLQGVLRHTPPLAGSEGEA
ncbi:MAG: ATP-dependent helicase [Anaerolineae bacterium]|nr:ATP-dependent helicase [Anaerolineae bacterium]